MPIAASASDSTAKTPSKKAENRSRVSDSDTRSFHRPDLGERQLFVHRGHLLPHQRRHAPHAPARAHDEVERRHWVLRKRLINLRRRGGAQAGLFHIAHDADDLAEIISRRTAGRDAFSDRILVREESPRDRLVDQHDGRTRCPVALREAAPA